MFSCDSGLLERSVDERFTTSKCSTLVGLISTDVTIQWHITNVKTTRTLNGNTATIIPESGTFDRNGKKCSFEAIDSGGAENRIQVW
jgi:hypothetical protein